MKGCNPSLHMLKPIKASLNVKSYHHIYFINSWIICILESGSSRSYSKRYFTVIVVSELRFVIQPFGHIVIFNHNPRESLNLWSLVATDFFSFIEILILLAKGWVLALRIWDYRETMGIMGVEKLLFQTSSEIFCQRKDHS